MADFDFLGLTSDDVVKKLVTGVESEISEPLYPGDERRLFLEALAAVVVQILQEANDNCKQRMLAYARGDVLDALGERLDVKRLSPTAASTVLRFSLAEPRTRQTFIPAGTRATPDGSVHFATLNGATIEAGNTSVDVAAQCTTGGSSTNGFAPGTIQTLTDSIAYIAGVTNMTTTSGGDDGEPSGDDDGDNRFRERIRLAPAKLTTAGPAASYEYWAKSANATITDVRTPADHDAGTVDIIVLTETGLPSEEVLADVLAVCNDKKIRPMNDKVTAVAPEAVSYDITLTYYVTRETEAVAVAAIEGDGGAVDSFVAWQDTKIGRDINPDRLRAFCLSPSGGTGALRVDVTAPAYQQLTERQVAQHSGTVKITHKVVEE